MMGLFSYSSSLVYMDGNVIHGNEHSGMILESSSNWTIINNDFQENTNYAMGIKSCDNNTIQDNQFITNENSAIFLVFSTYNILNEAVNIISAKDLALLYFKQVHPLREKTVEYLKKAKRTIIFENNATGQFAKQIKLHTGIDIDDKVLKYNGLSFTVEEVVEKRTLIRNGFDLEEVKVGEYVSLARSE